MKRRRGPTEVSVWDARRDAIMKRDFAQVGTKALAHRFSCSDETIRNHARRLGLIKPGARNRVE